MKIRLNIVHWHFFTVFDYILLFSMMPLIILGIFFIYSSGVNSNGVSISQEYIKQIVFASTGLLILIAFAYIDYRRLKRFAPTAYIILLCVLLYTLFFGRHVSGARSWLGIGDFGVQPSEFGKIIYILFLAWYLERSEQSQALRRFITAFGILFLPVVLILAQPDMGTASVYIPIFLTMLLAADIPLRYIVLVFIIGVLTIIFAILPVWQNTILKKQVLILSVLTNQRLRLIIITALSMIALISIVGLIFYKTKIYLWLTWIFSTLILSLSGSLMVGKVLKEYQMQRLIVFLNPDIDPLGSGWNIIQSKIAIGSGGLFGQGFLKGTQSHYRFLPQQSTDFIFSILAEELGFIGSLLVCALFFIIFIRILFILRNTKNIFGYYIGVGILTMFFFHFIVNVGMVMGIMPITGIPLPFLSYGGSSLWLAMWAAGILMSINYRRLDF